MFKHPRDGLNIVSYICVRKTEFIQINKQNARWNGQTSHAVRPPFIGGLTVETWPRWRRATVLVTVWISVNDRCHVTLCPFGCVRRRLVADISVGVMVEWRRWRRSVGRLLASLVVNVYIIYIIYSASVAGEETLHTYSYVQSHIKDIRWRIKTG